MSKGVLECVCVFKGVLECVCVSECVSEGVCGIVHSACLSRILLAPAKQ